MLPFKTATSSVFQYFLKLHLMLWGAFKTIICGGYHVLRRVYSHAHTRNIHATASMRCSWFLRPMVLHTDNCVTADQDIFTCRNSEHYFMSLRHISVMKQALHDINIQTV